MTQQTGMVAAAKPGSDGLRGGRGEGMEGKPDQVAGLEKVAGRGRSGGRRHRVTPRRHGRVLLPESEREKNSIVPPRLELVKALLLYIFWFPKLPLPKNDR
jgi:hypothetical protein